MTPRPRSAAVRDRSLFSAPRILNEPAICEIFALEEDAAAARVVERLRGDHRRAVDPARAGRCAAARTSSRVSCGSAVTGRLSQSARTPFNPRAVYSPACASRAILLLLVLLSPGCSLVSIDLTPRIKPLEERTVEGSGRAKILLTDISGIHQRGGSSPTSGHRRPAAPRAAPGPPSRGAEEGRGGFERQGADRPDQQHRRHGDRVRHHVQGAGPLQARRRAFRSSPS